MRAKYVMTELGPILFPETMKHSDFKDFSPTSAGIVTVTGKIVVTSGHSLTLNLKSEPGDSRLIKISLKVVEPKCKV